VLISFWKFGADGISLVRILGLATFTDNFLSAAGVFNPMDALGGHLWTISYEEQVYLFVPIFLSLLFPKTPRFQVIVVLSLFGLGTIIRALFIYLAIPHPAIWVLPFTHFESVLLGLFVGMGVYEPFFRKTPGWLIVLAGFLALGSIILLPYIKIISWYLMILYPLVGIGTSLLVYSAIKFREQSWIAWMGCKPLAYLGKISYGLYLYHLPCLFLVKELIKYKGFDLGIMGPSSIFFGALIITIGVAVISFEFIEKPFLIFKKKFSVVSSRPV
jgi:peptidoglycan/LPS O-acetylase OafA/YrhL